MTLALVYNKTEVLENLNLPSLTGSTQMIIIIVSSILIILIFLIISYLASFKVAHFIFRPLRVLNLKLKNIKSEGMKKDL